MIPLGELITLQRGHDLPSSKRAEGCIPIMGSSGITGYHNKAKCIGEGVIVGRSGNSMGEVSFVDEDYWPLNTCLYVTDFKGNDPKYIYYLLKTVNFDQFNSGSAQKSLNRNAVYPFEVHATRNKEVQREVGNCLSRIESKVTLNIQTNQTLEEMAQAIFKSWFVDFDPVKAKLNGEQPKGMDAATASLFPEKLVESELGLIPDGWKVKPFSEWVKITKGKNITKKTIVEGDVPVVAGGLKPAYFHNAHNVNGPAITISASGANAGYVNLYFENIWASDCSYISQSATPMFFLQYVALRYNQKKIFDMQTGAAQPHIYPRDFERLMVAVPNEELCRKLEDVFSSFFGTIANNKQQNIELAALRDMLLPKLLSGEIELEVR